MKNLMTSLMVGAAALTNPGLSVSNVEVRRRGRGSLRSSGPALESPYTPVSMQVREPDFSPKKNNKLQQIQNVLGMQGKTDECLVEPIPFQGIKFNQSIMQTALERVLITSIATMGLAVVLPPVKQLGLIGSVSLNHNIWKSAAAIGPIVTFTANMPALLGHMMKSIPGFKELPENSKLKIAMKIAVLATIKHFWVWPHENSLNALSTGLGKKGLGNINIRILGRSLLVNEALPRRMSHLCREAVLIACVGQKACSGIGDQGLSYLNKALMQAAFDRIAFPVGINPLFTIASRFLYLMFVKEVIDKSTQMVKVFSEKKDG